MRKIMSLTPDQEKLLPAFRDEWLQIGLDTTPVDFSLAEQHINRLYAWGGLTPPKYFLHFSSPMLCELWINFLTADNRNPQLRGQLRDQLGDQLGDQLRGQLRDQLGDQLRDQLWDQLGGQDLFQSPWTIGGQDAYWLSFYDFGRFIGAKYSNNGHFDAYVDYAKHCGWMFAYQQIAFVSDRPTKATFDERGLLHCEAGMAVEYSDGWGICAWRGLRVPDEWILNKQSLTAKTALTHKNVEQRRAACEILGWNTVLRELNARTIDKHENPLIGELLEVEIPDVGKERFLRCMCGTGREFALPVPPNMQRAKQANAWLNFEDEHSYQPEIRT